jgi:hypothetical protein
MTATTSVTPNRIAPYLSEPAKCQPPLPSTREGREAVLSDAVFAAIAALQGLLTHSDPKVVMKAAEMILNLETTRQRHGRVLIGMDAEPERGPHTPYAILPDPHTACANHTPRATNHANTLNVFIEKVRAELQSQEDAEGTGVVVSHAQAEECARYIQANMRQTRHQPVGLDSAAGEPDAIRGQPVPAAKECRSCPSPTRPLRPSPSPISSPATVSPAPPPVGGRTATR